MRTLFVLLVMIVTLIPSYAMAQDRPSNQGWSYSVGVGAIVTPAYLGDDDYYIVALPAFTVNYADKFFVSIQDGMGYNFINNDHWRLGVVGRYDFGRDDDGSKAFRMAGDETDDLRGLGDVDGTTELGGFVEFNFHPISAKVEVRQGLGGHEGLVAEASVAYKGNATIGKKPVIYSFGPEIKYADSNYHAAYFSINAAQSAASGLSPYAANAGLLSYGVGGSMVVALTERLSTVTFASISRLGNEAADSSLVRERGSENQGFVGLFITYNF